jgi:hypothetical protein
MIILSEPDLALVFFNLKTLVKLIVPKNFWSASLVNQFIIGVTFL